MNTDKLTLLKQKRESRLAGLNAHRQVSRIEAQETDRDIREAMQSLSASQYVNSQMEVCQ